MGTLGKIALIITPWLFVIGLFTYLAQGRFQVPTGNDLLVAIASFRGVEAMRNLGTTASEFTGKIDTAFSNVTDLITFFQAVGTFFSAVGDVIGIFISIIAIPLELIAWLFSFIFVGVTPAEETTTSAIAAIQSI